MPKVSIIIPVYNAQQYIKRCAKSLFSQTLKDIEFVFVDDCSQDRSIDVLREVLEEYPHRKSQTRIVRHDMNQGSAAARKTGLEHAEGNFIGWCDSDDWVVPEMYQILYETAIRKGHDLVCCDYFHTDGERNTRRYQTSRGKVLSDMMLESVSWNLFTKLAEKGLYTSIVFPKYNIGEDMVITLQLAFYAKSIGFVDEALYYYFHRPGSLCTTRDADSVLNRWKHAKGNTDTILHFIRDHMIFSSSSSEVINLKYLVRMHLMPMIEDKEVYRLWKNTYPEINSRLLFTRKTTVRRKLNFLAVLLRIYPFLNRSR